MRIGLDLDDTICSTIKVIEKYEKQFCKIKNITNNLLWTTLEYKTEFLNNYLEKIYTEARLKNNSRRVINELKNNGNKVFIITARTNNYVTKRMDELINDYFKLKNIKIDNVIINAKDKVKICKELNIDIMLEDNIYNYEKLTKANINTILYDESNQYLHINNRINNWNEFDKIINN